MKDIFLEIELNKTVFGQLCLWAYDEWKNGNCSKASKIRKIADNYITKN